MQDAEPSDPSSPVRGIGRGGLILVSSYPHTAGDDGRLRPGVITCTFRSHGPLGLKLMPDEVSGRAVVVKIHLGTQAENHSQLRPGLFIQDVGPTDVSGFAYTEVLDLLKACKNRPLTLTFLTEVPNSSRSSARPALSVAAENGADGAEELPRVRSAEAKMMLTEPADASDITENDE